jgi:hypothetical protein
VATPESVADASAGREDVAVETAVEPANDDGAAGRRQQEQRRDNTERDPAASADALLARERRLIRTRIVRRTQL